MYAEVCFPFSLNKTFTYYVPSEMQSEIRVGHFVNVQFRSKYTKGLITQLTPQVSFKGKVHPISSIDKINIIPPELWDTLQWMENYYVTPMGKIIQVAFSWLFKKNITHSKKIKHIRLKIKNFNHSLFNKNQNDFIQYLLKHDSQFIPLVDLNKKFKSTYGTYVKLKEKGIIEEKLQTLKNIQSFKTDSIDDIELTQKQDTIYHNIYDNFQKNYKPNLLHGVTGSGKTEIYLKLTHDFFIKKKSCLVLVPEISLSSQIYNRFRKYFGNDVVIWHSKISDKNKRLAWEKLNSKKPLIIIGARSALFSPLYNLGLIIVDEEHDTSYKESDKQPSYSARDMSIIRAKFSQSMVLLGSATPSLESYYNTILNKYHLHILDERYGGSKMPSVEVVNMLNIKDSFILKPILSDISIKAIQETLDKKEQILILHNRRGFSSLRISSEPDGILKCKNCDIILTLHHNNNELICHHCHTKYLLSSIQKKYKNSEIHYAGYGTEQLELFLNNLFPSAVTLRMDADTAKSMKAQNTFLNNFKKGNGDILLGTQMISKGLDFDNLTLVVVVNADLGSFIPDFRSHEKMFQLIFQVIGRAGRRKKSSKAIIQTYQPNHKIINMSTQYDLKNFYNLQLNNRKEFAYPPFSRLIRIIFTSTNVKQCQDSSSKIFNLLSKLFSPFLLGPLPCPIEKLSNKFRYHIIIKAPTNELNKILDKLNHIQKQKELLISNKVHMLIDIDSNSVL